jgi:hypothetical protein
LANLPSWQILLRGKLVVLSTLTLLGEEIICGKVTFLGQLSPAANLPFCNDISFFEKLADQGERAFIDEAAFFPTSSWKGCSVSMVMTSVLMVDFF